MAEAPITLTQVTDAIKEAVAPILDALNVLGNKVTALDEKVTALDEKVSDLANQQKVVSAKQENSHLRSSEPLVRVPLPSGAYPDAEFPPTIAHLVVSGAELLPNSNIVNSWTKVKSRALLSAYGLPLDDYGSDTETGVSSRKARLEVARFIGVTTTQLNDTQHIYW